MTTDRQRLPAVWKMRRDGIRQRYRVNPAARERDKRIVCTLQHALQDADYETTAVFIRTPEVIEAIDRQWNDIYDNFIMRLNLERAMIHIGDESIPLLERLLHRTPTTHPRYGVVPSADLAMRVIEALNLHQYRETVYQLLLQSRPFIDYLTGKTNNWDWYAGKIGEAALRCAARLGDTRIVPILESMMPPRTHGATELVAQCLPKVVEREHAIQQLGELYKLILDDASRTLDSDKYDRARLLLTSLAHLHAEAYAQIIENSIRYFLYSYSRLGAQDEIDPEILSAGYPPEVYYFLIDIVQDDPSRFQNPDVVPNAIEGLGRMGNPNAIKYLLPHALRNDEFKAFSDSREHMPAYVDDYRENAFRALAMLRATSHMSDDDARELLHQMVRFLREGYGKFTHDDSYLPYRVAKLIVELNDPRVLPIIESHLRDEWRPSYRVALYDAYAGVGQKDAVPFLIQQFDSEPPQVQSAIVRALKRIDTPDARRFLQTVPNNPHTSTLAKLTLHSPKEERT